MHYKIHREKKTVFVLISTVNQLPLSSFWKSNQWKDLFFFLSFLNLNQQQKPQLSAHSESYPKMKSIKEIPHCCTITCTHTYSTYTVIQHSASPENTFKTLLNLWKETNDYMQPSRQQIHRRHQAVMWHTEGETEKRALVIWEWFQY